MAHRSANLFLIVTTFAALVMVPDWPHRHLQDPSYWGVAGFVVVVLRILYRPDGSWAQGGANRRTVRIFLAGLPLIYVADWLRFGGSGWELAIQAAGLGVWVFLAVRARSSDLALWFGCVAHGLWDAAHFGHVSFVPQWYVAACIAADVGLGAYVLLQLKAASWDRAP